MDVVLFKGTVVWEALQMLDTQFSAPRHSSQSDWVGYYSEKKYETLWFVILEHTQFRPSLETQLSILLPL